MPVSRRIFLETLPGVLVWEPAWAAGREMRADVAVIGGGTGGCAAALAALRLGRRVVMTEETSWIGGQLTSQAVPPDEHPWIEMFGATASWRAFREGVRGYYRAHYPLTPEARLQPRLNPGGGSVSALCHEPKVALAVLESMLAPYVSGGQLILLRRHKPVAADVDGDRVRGITIRSLDTGADRVIQAPFFIDATELGDLLPMTRTEFHTGFEDRNQPHNQQAFTVCFALGYEKDADHTIDRPEEYSFWRDYVPKMDPPWPGKLLSWSMTDPISLKERKVIFDPEMDSSPAGSLNLWIYRRIVRARNLLPGACRGDVTLVNWPQNDYWLGNLVGVSDEERERHLRRARQLSLSLVYWMQTDCGWRGLHLRPDITGTEDGLAMYPYVRESRRIQAEFTVKEEHVGTEARMKASGKSSDEVTAAEFPDSVGVGSYRIDLHPSSGGDNYIDVSSLPFQIPLGALIPKRMENLLPGCKNLGVTHITNGCYRLHPVEWNIGEAAGALAAHCAVNGLQPRQVRHGKEKLAEFQSLLTRSGVELAWPRLRPR